MWFDGFDQLRHGDFGTSQDGDKEYLAGIVELRRHQSDFLDEGKLIKYFAVKIEVL